LWNASASSSVKVRLSASLMRLLGSSAWDGAATGGSPGAARAGNLMRRSEKWKRGDERLC
jgi:hypothetical protein